jgi:hypothetical protein
MALAGGRLRFLPGRKLKRCESSDILPVALEIVADQYRQNSDSITA